MKKKQKVYITDSGIKEKGDLISHLVIVISWADILLLVVLGVLAIVKAFTSM